MALFLVRHAKAGDRSAWTGEDRTRPLTAGGRRQADRLAERFGPIHVTRVLSSPYVRCLQTVTPLAASKGLGVEPEARLAEGHSFVDVVELLAVLPDSTVMCSHGDVIPEVIEALLRRGADLTVAPDWRKCVTWVLDRDGEHIVRLSVIEPPPSEAA